MSDALRRTLAFSISLGVSVLDRWSKWQVETHVRPSDSRPVIPGFFNIVHSRNPGLAFSLFAETTSPWRTPVLIALSIVAVILLAVMLWRIDRLDTPSAVGLSLIFGGAAGNFFDRVRAGSVTDFIDFHQGTHHWYTFNVADASIDTGVGLLILSLFLAQRTVLPGKQV